jgi:hypothetical protein
MPPAKADDADFLQPGDLLAPGRQRFGAAVSFLSPASLMAHGSEPRPTAIIVVNCLTLVFGVGTTLTGLVLTIMKER